MTMEEGQSLKGSEHHGLLEDYVRELRDIRSSGAGVSETSYYPPLANLLNEFGKSLKPKVTCILQLANQGAGHPDGGLFTSDQLKAGDDGEPLLGQSPNRGVIEVKPASDDAWLTADSSQCQSIGTSTVRCW